MVKRISYQKLQDLIPIPNLIDVQIRSYRDFLQQGIAPDQRKDQGLQAVFKEVFPVESFDQNCVLDFVSYELSKSKRTVIECLRKMKTFSVSLYVTLTISNIAKNESREETVFLGDFPLMTERASFIINGVERVIISQLHRSPGIFFEQSMHNNGKPLFAYRMIPDRGSWLEAQYDVDDLIHISFDGRPSRRKFLITTFLRAIGYSSNYDILDAIYGVQVKSISKLANLTPEVRKHYYIAKTVSDKNENPLQDAQGYKIASELDPVTADMLDVLQFYKCKTIEVVDCSEFNDHFIKNLKEDSVSDTKEALKEIYKCMRPRDLGSLKNAKLMLNRLFFDRRYYDLGKVGRYKINKALNLTIAPESRVLHKEDFIAACQQLMMVWNGKRKVDDIDHLSNRRVRTVGELLQTQIRIGLVRTERLIRERMTMLDENKTITVQKLVNPKALNALIRDFFGRSELSQFMDQTNPLAELTNKRRLSSLGPGGLNRERAGFEVRDVHPSHYSRICPIETPEGANIGLISSLAIYSRINDYGFIEPPYRKVKNKKALNEIVYLDADEEEKYIIAQANAPLTKDGRFVNKYVNARYKGDVLAALAEDVQFMDVSPRQLISVAAGIIPFLEHDDANRALMGSNMQRQAAPLLRPVSPYVGTGLEGVIARDSKAVICCQENGIVESVSADKIVISPSPDSKAIKRKRDTVREYTLHKYMRSNSNTCINQKPIIRVGDKVKTNQVIADGAATQDGELSLGCNVTVAFMPWCGYNFEDAIVISDRLVREDIYTSIHISEFDIIARDTKLGAEEITRDIPNLSDDALNNLDLEGVIRIGTQVNPGDVLVGKITPKSETELDPEERLLRAIFGEKAADVKDSSLTVPSGTSGIVMDVEIERKVDINQAKLTHAETQRKIKEAQATFKGQYLNLLEELTEQLETVLLGSKLPFDIVDQEKKTVIIAANRKITKVLLRKLATYHKTYGMLKCPSKDQLDGIMEAFNLRIQDLDIRKNEVIERYEQGQGEILSPICQVKIYIASKRKISVGDKMAGRHGNKGIVAKIVPQEDLPFMADGNPVDIVLNPLGVPSRMNVGQVLETHLGHAAKILGIKIATPVFDGISEKEINELLQKSKVIKAKEKGWIVDKKGCVYDQNGVEQTDYFVESDGKTILYDGRTGTPLHQRVVVGEIYMMKLDHLIINKIHARSVGPYSLVTQQPLGGKAQNGGQRFGEMEVWALEAYGAAYLLQEMLTVKSDDVTGRTRIYESIINGNNSLEADIPESFNVLMNEMRSLSLNVTPKKESL